MRAHGWSRAIQDDGLLNYCKNRNITLSDFDEIDSRYLFLDEGYNLRPTELNAAFGIHQLSKIKEFNDKRKSLSDVFYNEIAKLKNINGPEIVKGCEPCFMALPITIKSENYTGKDAIQYLEEKGIESRPLIAGNLLRHPVKHLTNIISAEDKLHGANYHHLNSLYVGLSPKHSHEDIERLINVFIDLDKTIDM